MSDRPAWTFLSNHGHVLMCLAEDPEARLRDIAARVGITERSVFGIIEHLEDAGIVVRTKIGRRNTYAIDRGRPLRHEIEAQHTVGDLIDLLG
jgi:DNA-binding Lrp family transcriptional regulator